MASRKEALASNTTLAKRVGKGVISSIPFPCSDVLMFSPSFGSYNTHNDKEWWNSVFNDRIYDVIVTI